jgi:hypothetical protein
MGLLDACVEKPPCVVNISEMAPTLERRDDGLIESGDYRVIRRLQPRTEYHPPDDTLKLIAAVADVKGNDPECEKIIMLPAPIRGVRHENSMRHMVSVGSGR